MNYVRNLMQPHAYQQPEVRRAPNFFQEYSFY